jgi:hypothetical protein
MEEYRRDAVRVPGDVSVGGCRYRGRSPLASSAFTNAARPAT